MAASTPDLQLFSTTTTPSLVSHTLAVRSALAHTPLPPELVRLCASYVPPPARLLWSILRPVVSIAVAWGCGVGLDASFHSGANRRRRSFGGDELPENGVRFASREAVDELMLALHTIDADARFTPQFENNTTAASTAPLLAATHDATIEIQCTELIRYARRYVRVYMRLHPKSTPDRHAATSKRLFSHRAAMMAMAACDAPVSGGSYVWLDAPGGPRTFTPTLTPPLVAATNDNCPLQTSVLT